MRFTSTAILLLTAAASMTDAVASSDSIAPTEPTLTSGSFNLRVDNAVCQCVVNGDDHETFEDADLVEDDSSTGSNLWLYVLIAMLAVFMCAIIGEKEERRMEEEHPNREAIKKAKNELEEMNKKMDAKRKEIAKLKKTRSATQRSTTQPSLEAQVSQREIV